MCAKFIATTSRLFMFISSIFLVLMMLHVTADVLMKYFFNSPIEGTFETVTYYYMISIVFLPLAMVELRNEHIYVDLFVRRLPERIQQGIFIFACFTGIVYFSIMTFQTFIDALKATAERETVMSNYLFYVWPSRWALPIGMGCMVLALALNIGRALQSGRALEPQKDEEQAR
jgi:TRAP-type C4-dicarboxylate transport system permease small subunit